MVESLGTGSSKAWAHCQTLIILVSMFFLKIFPYFLIFLCFDYFNFRSHSVFTIVVQQKETDSPEGRGLRARINLVDLAGSERIERTGAEGQTLKEGVAINKR